VPPPRFAHGDGLGGSGGGEVLLPLVVLALAPGRSARPPGTGLCPRPGPGRRPSDRLRQPGPGRGGRCRRRPEPAAAAARWRACRSGAGARGRPGAAARGRAPSSSRTVRSRGSSAAASASSDCCSGCWAGETARAAAAPRATAWSWPGDGIVSQGRDRPGEPACCARASKGSAVAWRRPACSRGCWRVRTRGLDDPGPARRGARRRPASGPRGQPPAGRRPVHW
jgi:hypothetical protein